MKNPYEKSPIQKLEASDCNGNQKLRSLPYGRHSCSSAVGVLYASLSTNKAGNQLNLFVSPHVNRP